MKQVVSANVTNVTEHAFSVFEEFKNFAFKGNVIDMAIGVVIGGAFGKIVDSLVKHIIMPTIAFFLPGEQSYMSWKLALGEKEIPYGMFLAEIVNFLIVAFALYIFMVKILGFLTKKREQEAVKAPEMSQQEKLLTEIRDLLAKSR